MNLEDRQCPTCGDTLVRHENESKKEWVMRMYCNKVCAIKAQSERWHLDKVRRAKPRTA